MDLEIYNRISIARRMAVIRGDFRNEPYKPSQQLVTPYATPKYEESKKTYEGTDENKGYGIRLKKILGQGGYGIAALVEHTGRDNVITQCVMKVELAWNIGGDATKKEERALNKFKGAKHTVQILDLTKKIKAERNAFNAKHTTYSTPWLDGNWDIQKQRTRDFVLVEFAERGDLRLWLNKASRSPTPWPNKALWWLFRCFVKGLVGMGYPPLEHHKRNNPEWDPNDPIEEYIPQGSRGPQQTCHFDIDPLNVLVDSDEEHGDFPIFKINDFGEIQFYDEIQINPAPFTKGHFFDHRLKGKPRYVTPEQFHKDWDSIGNYDPNEFLATDGTKPKIAGNYGMHSNVYQVGVMMWCAITRCKFNPWGTYPCNGFETYGGALLDLKFCRVDLALRRTIMECMAQDPSHRPTLAQLLDRIEQELQRPGLESDHDIHEWAKEFFSTPRVPGDEPTEVPGTRMPGGNGNDAEVSDEPVLVGQRSGTKRECPPDDDHEDDHRYRSQRRIDEPQPAPQQLVFDALRDDQPASPAPHYDAQQQMQGGAANRLPPHVRHLEKDPEKMQQRRQEHPHWFPPRPPSVLATQKQQRRKEREQRRAQQSGQRQPSAVHGQPQQQQQVQQPILNTNDPAFQPRPQVPQFIFPTLDFGQAQQQQPQQPNGQQVHGYTPRFPQQGHQPPPQ